MFAGVHVACIIECTHVNSRQLRLTRFRKRSPHAAVELLAEGFENLSRDVRALYTWPYSTGVCTSAKKYSELTRLSPHSSSEKPVLVISM